MKNIRAKCYGYCRNCWKELEFEIDATKKTVREMREEINTIHKNWGCETSDVRLVRLTNTATGKIVNVQKPVEFNVQP